MNSWHEAVTSFHPQTEVLYLGTTKGVAEILPYSYVAGGGEAPAIPLKKY